MQNLFSNLSFAVKASLVMGLALLPAAELRAAGPFTVTTTTDSHVSNTANGEDANGNISLRSAIEAANADGGTTVIVVPAGTYNLTLGELDVANGGGTYNITINGTGATVDQTDGENRVFNIDPNSAGKVTVTLSGLTITGGTDKADSFGGAGILAGSLSATPADVLILNNCAVSGNACQALSTSSNPGGGVSMEGGNLTVSNCTISGNTSGSSPGAGVYFYPQSVASVLSVSGCTFSANSLTDTVGAGVGGSAIYIASTANNVAHIITDSTFSGNVVTGDFRDGTTYGTVQVENSGTGNTLGISGCSFLNNEVSSITDTQGLGAALAVNSGTVNVHYCRFFGNTGDQNSVLFSSVANSASVNATENWWGCNGGPGATGCGGITGDASTSPSYGSTVTFSPWLVLGFTPNSSTITVGGNSLLTASFLKDSAGDSINPNNLDALNGVGITFGGASGGSLSSPAPSIQSGTATVEFTAGSSPASGKATATVDNATVTADINITPGPATHFVVSLPSSATAGVAISGTITAKDQFGNTATGYAGTVQFTSSDGQALLPANSTLSSGVGTFSDGFTLKTSGNQTVTATDTTAPSITGTSGSVAVSPAAATHFAVSLPPGATAGVAFSGTVTALDQFDNTATGYSGTVHFTSTDGQSALPANSTLSSGVGTFSDGFTLKTSGNQTVTATDTTSSSITGTSGNVAVSAGAATHFVVSLPSSATAGVAFSGTVTALDQFNNTATGYSGTVQFTSSDGKAVLPANSTLTSGVGTFSFTLKTGGNQTVTATDTATSSITGTSGAVKVSAAAATHFAVNLPSSATAGVAFSGTVTALDQFNNTATGYLGTVHFTSSDGQAVLPANYTFTAGSAGVQSFAFTLKTAGNQTVTATDASNSSITGTSGGVTVGAGAATHFVVSLPSSATAGVAFSGTVTALDQFNNTATGYAGTAHFTSSDGQAVLPANSTLTSGIGTFSFTLKTSGNQTVTATDTTSSSITGTSGNVNVSAGTGPHFVVNLPASATAGVAFSGTVTVVDQFNNIVAGYAGTVHFTSSDGQAVLPANSTLTSGVGTFSFTLKTSGNQTVTATDTATSSITGTSGNVLVGAGTATHLVVSLPSSATAGVAFSGTVTAQDQFNNTATGYAGTVHFTSSDGQAVLPANSTLTSGVGTFSFTLKTSGNQTVTATDTATSSITGTSGNVLVGAGTATHLVVSLPSSATAGVAFSGTVTAQDQFNNTATGYAGTVHFTSSDGQATLPANSTLASGVGTFSFTLKTAGIQTVTATDTTTSSIMGISGAVTVHPGAATHLAVSLPSSATAGVAFSGTVTAQDQFNNTATGYSGTVHFTSGDGLAALPADATLTSGVGTFSFTLNTPGPQTVTATDTVNSSITGTSSVTVNAAAQPPVAGAFAMSPQENTPEPVPVAKILLVCSSPRGGTLSIANVTSPTGANGTVTLGGGLLTYTPAANYVGGDTINYTLSDGYGTAAGSIAVTVTSTNAPTQNGLTIQMSGNNAILQFHGIPGTSYYIQTSTPLATGPWLDLPGTPVTADALGLINYTAANPPTPSFYRTSTQP